MYIELAFVLLVILSFFAFLSFPYFGLGIFFGSILSFFISFALNMIVLVE